MAETATLTERPSLLRRGLIQSRQNPIIVLGAVIIVLWLFAALFAPMAAPFDPLTQNVVNRLTAPNATYIMGTDELGRDIFSRVLYGARITLPAALLVIVLDAIIGTIIGMVAGYLGGLWDEVTMRFTELFMAFPTIILAMAITAALGPDIRNAVIALVIVRWPAYARLMRSLILEARHADYVESARAIGANHGYILIRTLLPNTVSQVIVFATLDFGNAILLFAGLSFLGLGPEPSSPEWGRMVSIGIDFFDQHWMWLYPGLAIASIVMAFNFIGDGLRDTLDPTTRRR
jgi:peptide/nickel transport system permease protein